MQLFNSTTLPNAVISWIVPILRQFDFLNDDQPLSAIAYYVTPIGGDVSYVAFQHGKKTYVLIVTDHPDLAYDNAQLLKLSKKYRFGAVVTPTGQSVNVEDITTDRFLGDFFVRGDSIYYYCVDVTQIEVSS